MWPVLAKDVDEQVRASAAWALGEIGGDEVLEPLLAAARDPSARVRRAVIDGVAASEDPRAQNVVANGTRDPDERVRQVALNNMWTHAESMSFEDASRLVGDSDARAARAACVAVGKSKDPRALPLLVKVLTKRDYTPRFAAEGLRELGDPAAVPALIAVLNHGTQGDCNAVAHTLGCLGDPRAVKPLFNMWDLNARPERQYIVFGLLEIGTPEAVAAAERLVEPIPPAEVRRMRKLFIAAGGENNAALLVYALYKTGDHAMAEDLYWCGNGQLQALSVWWAKHDDFDKALKATANVGRTKFYSMGEPWLGLPFGELESPDAGVRATGARELGLRYLEKYGERDLDRVGTLPAEVPEERLKMLIGSEVGYFRDRLGAREAPMIASIDHTTQADWDSMPARLERALDDPDEGVRAAAATALGMTRDAKYAKAIAAVLDDPDERVKVAALEGLGQIRDERCRKALLDAMSDISPAIRRAGVRYYCFGNYPDAATRAVELLGDADGAVRATAAFGLWLLGDKSAIEPLAAVLKDEDMRVRYAAASALEHMFDPKADAAVEDAAGVKVASFVSIFNEMLFDEIAEAIKAGEPSPDVFVYLLARADTLMYPIARGGSFHAPMYYYCGNDTLKAAAEAHFWVWSKPLPPEESPLPVTVKWGMAR